MSTPEEVGQLIEAQLHTVKYYMILYDQPFTVTDIQLHLSKWDENDMRAFMDEFKKVADSCQFIISTDNPDDEAAVNSFMGGEA